MQATSSSILNFKNISAKKSLPSLQFGGGGNDPFFLPEGAEAYKRDIPHAEVIFYNTGHFALETHVNEIAANIRSFLSRHLLKLAA